MTGTLQSLLQSLLVPLVAGGATYNTATRPLPCTCRFSVLPSLDVIFSSQELDTHAEAAYYGLSSLSYPAVLRALMKKHALQRTLGVGDCEAMSLIYLDNVHPGAVGELPRAWLHAACTCGL